ncbi:Ice nucleation protein, partial [Pseudomonas syringae]|nr:Ice nucleation protein [Pseudomonas syringae]
MNLDKALVLRTCANNMADHCGLIWPASGTVESKYWQSTRRHENGLVGLLWGAGSSAFLSVHADARWIVCEVVVADIIALEEPGMVKFPRAEVVHVGDKISASHFISARQADHVSTPPTSPPTSSSTSTPMPTPTPSAANVTVSAAEQSSHEVFDVALVSAAAPSVNTLPVTTPQTLQTATYGSTLSGDNNSRLIAGYGSNETAGNHSDLIAGYGSTGTAGSDSSLVAGYGSTQTAGGDSALTAGYGSTQTAREGSNLTAGYGSTGTAGSDSSLIAGYGSTQTSGGDSSLTAGYGSTQTAQEGSNLTAGYGSTGTAGSD